MGAEIVVARPPDGTPVVLSAVTSLVWQAATEWSSAEQLEAIVGGVFPDVPGNEREGAIRSALELLASEDLIERG